MHFPLISPFGSKESVGGLSQTHYPTKTPGRVSSCSFPKVASTLSWARTIRFPPRKIPVLPLFTLQETIPICSCLIRRICEMFGIWFPLICPPFIFSIWISYSISPLRTKVGAFPRHWKGARSVMPLCRYRFVLVWTRWNWIHEAQLGDFWTNFSPFRIQPGYLGLPQSIQIKDLPLANPSNSKPPLLKHPPLNLRLVGLQEYTIITIITPN